MTLTALAGVVLSLALTVTPLPAAPPNPDQERTTVPEGSHECARAAGRCDGTLAEPLDATFVRVPFGTHSLAWAAGKPGDCVRAALRSFVTHHRVPPARCTAENHRAIGAFPSSLSQVDPLPATGLDAGRRRVLAAAFATAADAAARRNPGNLFHGRLKEQPGLRGGRVTFGDGVITLDEAAYVPGVTASGRLALAPEGRATASLDVRAAGRAYRVELAWEAFTAQERPALSGILDGTPFQVPEQN
ncbi:hypothetical protein ACWDA3_08790 [Nonomuraea rubra]